MKVFTSVTLFLALVLAACGGAAPSVSSTAVPTDRAATTPTSGGGAASTQAATGPATAAAPSSDPIESIVGRARADLARRLGVGAEEIRVAGVEEVTWPDSSLGCPQPGMMYAQVLQDGLRIRLVAQGHEYDYHSGGAVEPFLCEQVPPAQVMTAVPMTPSATAGEGNVVKPTAGVDPGLQPHVDAAKADLANRLSIEPAGIEVVAAEAVVWPDSSLGCPAPGMNYLQVLTDGYRIDLRARGQTYAYHGGGSRGPFLCQNPSR